MASDRDQFNCMKLYHVIIPSITFYKMVSLFSAIDKKIGGPLEKLLDWISKVIFSGWSGIHPMGFNKNEEDEGLWFYNFTSPALCLITPHYQRLHHLDIFDELPDSIKTPNTKYYLNTLKRMQFAMGESRTFLMKSVMSSGRIHQLLKIFPDARFIYIKRSPYKTIPSYISMFSAPWRLIAPKASATAIKDLGRTAISFYKHSKAVRETTLKKENLIELNYEEFINNPLASLKNIYSHFNIEMGNDTLDLIKEKIESRRNYKSSHQYSLEEFGWSEEELEKELL